MIIIFNQLAILPVVFGATVGFMAAAQIGPLVGAVLGSMVGLTVDVLQRFFRGEGPYPLFDTHSGGHLYYVPVWMLSVISLVMTGLVYFEFAGAKRKPGPPPVVQHQPAPDAPAVPQPRFELPGAPKGVQQAAPPDPVQPVAAAQPVVQAPPPRPEFADAVIKPLPLENGRTKVEGNFAPAVDAIDRDRRMSVKIYELDVVADAPCFIEAQSLPGAIAHVRLETPDGQVLEQQSPRRSIDPVKFLYVPVDTGTIRIVLATRSIRPDQYSLNVRVLQSGDVLAENERIEVPRSNQPLRVAKTIERFLAAAIAADSQSAWVAYPQGKLERLSLPDFAVTDTCTLPKQAYLLALAGDGMLCAAVHKELPARPLPGQIHTGPADVHIYNAGTLGAKAQPAHIVPVGAIIDSLIASPDGERAYFLDSQNLKLGRVNVATGQLDAESPKVAEGTKSLCLSPDGTALYSCATTNVVQKFDPATLELQATIQLDRGAPNGIQATDHGDLFLKSSERGQTHIFLLNAYRTAEPMTKVTSFASVYEPGGIVLSPDQTRLYIAIMRLSPASIVSYPVPAARPELYWVHESGTERFNARGARGSLTISPDGRFLFCDSGEILALE